MLDHQRNTHSMKKSSPSAIDVLRAAANGTTFDEERARSDTKAAIDSYGVAALYSLIHKDQVRSREVEKVLESVVSHLHKLRERLNTMSGETWRDWQWIASDAYNELPDVRQELNRRNATSADEFADTDLDLCDYVVTAVDQVGRDLAELERIVAKVEPRLRAVLDAMVATTGKDGRPRQVARQALFRNLRIIYERDTGRKATASEDVKNERGLGARSRFIDFVVAVNQELRPPLSSAGLGTAIKNFLYPPKSKS